MKINMGKMDYLDKEYTLEKLLMKYYHWGSCRKEPVFSACDCPAARAGMVAFAEGKQFLPTDS